MPVTLLQIHRFQSVKAKWWAFKQMPTYAQKLKSQYGARFAKQLGTGAGEGFSLWPDWSTYCTLSVWEHTAAAHHYLNSQAFRQSFKDYSFASTNIWMKGILSRGQWNGENPFVEQKGNANPELLGVITRASIKKKMLAKFWSNVPAVSRSMHQLPGKLYSKGIGERPLLEQATFSVWENQKLMQNFAYHQKEHKKVVQKTQQLNWYSEELFARFEIVKIEGEPLFKPENS